MPTLGEVPPIQTILVESDVHDNPLGVKGVGEGGIASAPAAVANAVADALGPAGAAVDRIPLTPARIRAMLGGHDDERR